jgi:3-oxoacyl-[acyl-carrier protein] reductase
MNYDFHDKCVLVTGGSRGIGKAIAHAFASRGAQIAINYRTNDEAAHATLAQLPGAGHVLVKGDVADPAVPPQIVASSVKAMGRIDVLVNNAGRIGHHPPAVVDYATWQEEWRGILATNLLGAANLSFCVAQQMIQQGGGRIVNISSRGAFRGEPTMPAYGASKAGLNSLSQSLAVALAPHGIFVGVVAPGFTETEMAASRLAGAPGDAIRAQSPLNRVAQPAEVAAAALFLAADGTEFTTGTIIDVNGASYLRS